MNFNTVYEAVKHVPFISSTHGKYLYDLIVKRKPSNILELGIAHGTASCYMAAALEENKGGHLTCVDIEMMSCLSDPHRAKSFPNKKMVPHRDWFSPNIETQLSNLNLEKYVDVFRMKTGYSWFLHDEIKRQTDSNNKCSPKYDLIIIDGPKNWIIDSSAFFLCDKLLNRGGVIIWDDYGWTYENSNKGRTETDGIRHDSFSEEELTTPHIKEIFNLLVKQHPEYHRFEVDSGDWCWAVKK